MIMSLECISKRFTIKLVLMETTNQSIYDTTVNFTHNIPFIYSLLLFI